jgi:hypothetical protein
MSIRVPSYFTKVLGSIRSDGTVVKVKKETAHVVVNLAKINMLTIFTSSEEMCKVISPVPTKGSVVVGDVEILDYPLVAWRGSQETFILDMKY